MVLSGDDKRREQMEALRELSWLYYQCILCCRPRCIQCKREEDGFELARELGESYRDLSRQVGDARRRLLATGLNVPNDWLTVRCTGRLAQTLRRVPGQWIVRGAGVDTKVLDRVRSEMDASMLRLEAGSLHLPVRGPADGGAHTARTRGRSGMGAPRFRSAEMDRQIAGLWFGWSSKAGLKRYEDLIPRLSAQQRAYIRNLPGRLGVTGFEIELCIKNWRRSKHRNRVW